MNNLKDKSVLIIYDGTNANYLSYFAAMVAYTATEFGGQGQTVDLIDVSGKDDTAGTEEINALVAAKSDDTYDKIIVTCDIHDVGTGAGHANYNTLGLLWDKLKTSAQGTPIASGSSGDTGGGTAKFQLDAADDEVNDYYNECMVIHGSDDNALILDYVHSSRLVEVGGKAITDDSGGGTAYEIYKMDNILITKAPALALASVALSNTLAADGCTSPALVWEFIRLSASSGVMNTFPEIIAATSSAYYYEHRANCSGTGTTNKIADTGQFTIDAEIGNYVYIYVTPGIGQWGRITDNTADQLTVGYIDGVYKEDLYGGKTAWTTDPTTESYYCVVKNWNKMFLFEYYQMAIKTYLNDITDSGVQGILRKILDEGSLLDAGDVNRAGLSVQNKAELQTLKDNGEAIFKGTFVTAALT